MGDEMVNDDKIILNVNEVKGGYDASALVFAEGYDSGEVTVRLDYTTDNAIQCLGCEQRQEGGA